MFAVLANMPLLGTVELLCLKMMAMSPKALERRFWSLDVFELAKGQDIHGSNACCSHEKRTRSCSRRTAWP